MRKCRLAIFFCIICAPLHTYCAPADIPSVITTAQHNCGQISEYFLKMKTKAAINTAVTGVGTVLGTGAVITGFIKAKKDYEIEQLLETLQTNQKNTNNTNCLSTRQAQEFEDSVLSNLSTAQKITNSDISQAEKQSKKLGNARTGLLAANTATNIAGTAIAGTNTVSQDLTDLLNACRKSLNELHSAKTQAKVEKQDDDTINKIEHIINACQDFETLDITPINTRAKGAAISSGLGAGIGLAGTITSATANSEKIRNDNSTSGKQKEKNLNTTSNILAIGATAASGTATIFNATQIKTLNKAIDVATKCKEALNQ